MHTYIYIHKNLHIHLHIHIHIHKIHIYRCPYSKLPSSIEKDTYSYPHVI